MSSYPCQLDARTPKVLAIDDNRDNLTTVGAMLREALPGCTLVTAADGARGIELARAEDPDVVLLDILMPGMDGFEVCRRMKAEDGLCDLPVVFLTALGTDRESRLKALAVGGEGFLDKPPDQQELTAQILAMAQLRAARRARRLERDELAALVAERTVELERSRESLRILTGRMEMVREEERVAVSRELHDNLGQVLTALKLDVAWLQRHLKRGDGHPLEEKLASMMGLTEEAIAGVRRLAADLRPAMPDHVELWAAVEAEAARFTSRTGISCDVVRPAECSICRSPIDRAVGASILRIVQEALTNVARHANAGSVRISCRSEAGFDELSIEDDGCGLPANAIDGPASIGIVGMRERALSFGGGLHIDGTAGRGTAVRIRLPNRAPTTTARSEP